MTLQQDLHTMTEPNLLELPDFSLVLGGPLFQLFRRARLDQCAGGCAVRTDEDESLERLQSLFG
jgi:hypothetical protein